MSSGEGCPICGMPRWLSDVLGPCEHTPEEWSEYVRKGFREALADLDTRPSLKEIGDG